MCLCIVFVTYESCWCELWCLYLVQVNWITCVIQLLQKADLLKQCTLLLLQLQSLLANLTMSNGICISIFFYYTQKDLLIKKRGKVILFIIYYWCAKTNSLIACICYQCKVNVALDYRGPVSCYRINPWSLFENNLIAYIKHV
jgi:hypothetical protein